MEPGKRLYGGAILFGPGDKMQGHGLGRVTSVTYSPSRAAWVALGLVARDAAKEGTELICTHPIKGEAVRVRIVSSLFLDPKGERLHG
jgi:sarcosine oxidase subunit alpha